MKSRLLPLVIGLGVGLCLLLWGLASLQGIIIDERAQANATIEQSKVPLIEYARRTLEQRLEARLHDKSAQFESLIDDPLAPSDELLLVVDGTQRAPLVPAQPSDDTTTPARDLYDQLRRGQRPGGDAPEWEPGSPKAQRIEIFFELRDALQRGDDNAIAYSVRSLLGHRARFVLDATFDVPLNLAALDDFTAKHEPHPDLMRTILRDGHDSGPGARVESLQRTLLTRRDRFTSPDLRFLADRITALSRDAGVVVDDFRAAIDPPPGRPIPRPPVVDAPIILGGGHWYAAAYSDSQVRGIAIDWPAEIESLQQHMHDRALLQDDDQVLLPRPTTPTELAELGFTIESPRLLQARTEAEQRFRLKTGFVLATAVLAALLAVLAVTLQRRRHRFVQLKSDFVSTVSHELRTPLASIRLMAETLARRTRSIPAARDYPDRIVREIDELAFLVENILSFNRLDRGRWQPRRSEVQLAALLDTLTEDLPIYGFEDVRVDLEDSVAVTLDADRELLMLLFRNLAKNACTYNERSPVQLSVAARLVGDRFIVRFSDNGVGIRPADQAHIFDDFRRGSPADDSGSTAHRARGSGLGLSICRKSMEAHHGHITIERSGPEGTCFALDFPATMVIANVAEPS